MNLRIGNGYDAHALRKGHPFYIGGVKIAHHSGAYGHSDADVLLHAICDSLLGALALGDIGTHFPDSNPTFEGIESRELLQKTMDIVGEKDYHVVNIDSTVCLQEPRLKDYIPAMRKEIAKAMNLSVQQVSVKATTTEWLGFVGREEGVSAYAVALLNATR